MGDLGTLFDLTLLFTAILFAGAISGYLSERAGIVNLGIDGMMCIGALFFGIFSSTSVVGFAHLGFGGLFFAFILSMICTSIMGIMHAFACIKLRADHTIVGTAINLVGLAIATFLNSPLANVLYPGKAYSKIMCQFQSCFPIGSGSLFGSSIIILFLVIIIAIVI
jgi:simple sugar transport system permease protein